MASGVLFSVCAIERRVSSLSPHDLRQNPAHAADPHPADLMLPVPVLLSLHPTTIPEPDASLSAVGIAACCVTGRDDCGGNDSLVSSGDLRQGLQAHGQEAWSHLTTAEQITSDAFLVAPAGFAIKVRRRTDNSRCGADSVLLLVDAQSRMDGLLRLHDRVQAGLG